MWVAALVSVILFLVLLWIVVLVTRCSSSVNNSQCNDSGRGNSGKRKQKNCVTICPKPRCVDKYTERFVLLAPASGKPCGPSVTLVVNRVNSNDIKFALVSDSLDVSFTDVWLDVQTDPAVFPVTTGGCLDYTLFASQILNVSVPTVTFQFPTTESGILYFSIRVRILYHTKARTLSLRSGQRPTACCDKKSLRYDSVTLCVPPRILYQNITGGPLDVFQTPDSLGGVIVGTVPAGSMVREIDTQVYNDVTPSGIKFLHVQFTSAIQGYVMLRDEIAPGNTVYFLAVTYEALIAQAELDEIIDRVDDTTVGRGHCVDCLQAPIISQVNPPLSSGDGCCQAAYAPCYSEKESQWAGTYCIFNSCGNECTAFANGVCGGGC